MISLQAALLAAVVGGAGETVLLDFYADWCGPCRQMAPVIEQLAAAGYPVRKVNIDHEKELAAKFGVRGIPCFVMLVDGQEVDRVVGATSSRRLERMFAAAKTAGTRSARPRGGPFRRGFFSERMGLANSEVPKPRLSRGQSPDAVSTVPPRITPGRVAPPRSPAAGGVAGTSGQLSEAPPYRPPAASGPSDAPRQSVIRDETTVAAIASPQALPAVPARNATSMPQGAAAPGGSAGVALPVAASADAPLWQAAPSSMSTTPNAAAGAESSVVGAPVSPPGQPATMPLETRLMQASVRLRVEDSQGRSVGSGTIIDVEGDQALVVTCGHIFRESKGRGRIAVDLFGPGAPRTVSGKLIGYNLENDVALVCIETQGPVTAVDVASSMDAYRVGSAVINIGCNHGNDPTLRRSRITSLDKFVGPARIVVADAPVEGRSGGGLFTADGRLIGVCHAADPQDNEGLYAALPLIHAELDKAHLAHVYLRRPGESTAGALARAAVVGIGARDDDATNRRANATSSDSSDNEIPAATKPSRLEPPAMAESMPGVLANASIAANGSAVSNADRKTTTNPADASNRSTPAFASDSLRRLAESAELLSLPKNGSPVNGMVPGGAASVPAGLANPLRTGARAEVICVIRQLDDPTGEPQIVVIRQPSATLLEQLAREGQARQPERLTSLEMGSRGDAIGR